MTIAGLYKTAREEVEKKILAARFWDSQNHPAYAAGSIAAGYDFVLRFEIQSSLLQDFSSRRQATEMANLLKGQLEDATNEVAKEAA